MKNTSEKTKKRSKTVSTNKRSEMGLDVENQRGSRKIRRQEQSEDEDLLDDE